MSAALAADVTDSRSVPGTISKAAWGTAAVDGPRRRCVMGLLSALLLAVGCGAPGADVEELSAEPILTPPMEAVELGRISMDGSGFGMPVTAVLEVAYAVDMSPQEAQRQWVRAYREDYQLGLFGGLQVMGRSETAGVELAFGPSVVALVDPEHPYREPPDGWTVVTLRVDGLHDSEGNALRS